MAPKQGVPQESTAKKPRGANQQQNQIRATCQNAAFAREDPTVRVTRPRIPHHEQDPSRSPRDGRCHLFRLPAEIRISIYDMVFANVKHAGTYNWQIDPLPHTGKDPLDCRLVNRQIARESFHYLFRTFDLGWIATAGNHSNHPRGPLSDAIKGRWERIQQFEIPMDNVFPRRYQSAGAFDSRLRIRDTTEYVNALRQRSELDELTWPLEQRNVHTMTMVNAQTLQVVPGQLGSDLPETRTQCMLAYLALIVRYFPSLTELRLVFSIWGKPQYIARYRIDANEVSGWYTHQREWTLPQLNGMA